MPPNATFALLGDLGKYVAGSGYRFRLSQDERLIVVGQPNEAVEVRFGKEGMRDRGKPLLAAASALQLNRPTPTCCQVTYLTRSNASAPWTAHVERVVVGADGRTKTTLSAPGWPTGH